jgi:hypothetical protein
MQALRPPDRGSTLQGTITLTFPTIESKGDAFHTANVLQHSCSWILVDYPALLLYVAA